jgi:enamine deaminase RidA (YjgF/YER057c/UK114 family)
MKVQYVNPPFLHEPVDAMYSHISVATGFGAVYRIGGQVPVDAAGENVAIGEIAGQIEACYEFVTRSLGHFGLGWPAVTHLLIFTTRLSSYMEHEPRIAPRFFGDSAPPSTLVEVKALVDDDWMVEIQADAVGPPPNDDRKVTL